MRMLPRRLVLLLALAVLPSAVAADAQAQVLTRIKEAAKQRVTERRERTRDQVVQRATEPVDSTLERLASPVDSLASRAGGAAAGAVSRLGREDAAAREAEERRLVEQLGTLGRAELPAITFGPGSDSLSGGGPALTALANVLAANPGAYLIEGWGPASEARSGRAASGERRAAALRASLVASGIPAGQLFTTGVARPLAGGAQVAVVRIR